jgi:hypothetical protein
MNAHDPTGSYKIQSIASDPSFKGKLVEELRFEDYRDNQGAARVKGVPAGPGVPGGFAANPMQPMAQPQNAWNAPAPPPVGGTS